MNYKMKIMPIHTIEWDEHYYDVEYTYEAGEPSTYDHPGADASVDIKAIWHVLKDKNGVPVNVDILPLLEQQEGFDRDELQEEILDELDNKEYDYETYED
jgi:hypothetical protein